MGSLGPGLAFRRQELIKNNLKIEFGYFCFLTYQKLTIFII